MLPATARVAGVAPPRYVVASNHIRCLEIQGMSPSGWEFDHVGRAVRAAREADGVSQRELARRAGISPSVISRIEAGIVRQPDERTSDRIAAALGRSGRALYY